MLDLKPNFQIKLFKRWAYLLLLKMVAPRSNHEDDRRREFILNVILLGIVSLATLMDISLFYNQLRAGADYNGVNFLVFTSILFFFVFLYWLSRSGRFILASYILITLIFLFLARTAFVWGPDLPIVLLGFGLLIVISSILFNTRFSFLVTLLVMIFLLPLGYGESAGFFMPRNDWKTEPLQANDMFIFGIILFMITLISWLSNREIERSLRRAHRSEAELKSERDLLEVKVEERTAELKKLESERIAELSRFAEFGRLAAGMIHDLLSPLTAVALNVEELSKQKNDDTRDTEENIESAIRATKKMENFILAIRKQLSRKEVVSSFTIEAEVLSVLELLNYKARHAGVVLLIQESEPILLQGDPVKFHQIVSNLVSNAIDAYEGIQRDKKIVRVCLRKVNENLRAEVEDSGIGIDAEHLPRIFDPFFTTKDFRHGTGIGLATAKHLIETYFGGTIRAESILNKGTKIIVELPIDRRR